ncbi:MAG: cation:dicarboxylase symporter family transporter, partial [Planctomycetota bacterium]
MRLWHFVLIALVLGVFLGLVAPSSAQGLEPLGQVFLRAIKMIVPLLVFSTVVTGTTSIGSLQGLARLGAWTFTAYLITTLAAIAIGLSAGGLSTVGQGIELNHLNLGDDVQAPEALSLTTQLVQVVPTNPLAAMVDGNVLQILFFAILLATSILMCGAKAEPIARGLA